MKLAMEVCPTCKMESEVLTAIANGNQTTKTYSCGHSSFNITLSESLSVKESLRLRGKDPEERSCSTPKSPTVWTSGSAGRRGRRSSSCSRRGYLEAWT